ncbi:MAG: hypothetical protein EOM76_02460 [Sphingobacteriia bacterium]|jgi:tetratricopeptide (TPR) repeat protein|nr:hypothetical protein [Paludibacteraceae bacterium]NCA79039.1 hypothetical protein [Sphingobacteriia bacterium]
MKLVKLFGVVACAMATMSVLAQDNEAKASSECLLNQSLFYEAAKVKNYSDAVTPWEAVYKECPSLSKAIYIYGVRIVVWQMENEKDATKREALFEKLMKLYDDQVKYFGDDPKAPAPYILGMKAYYYIQNKPNDKQTPYAWLKQSITELKEKARPTFLQQFVVLSNDLYKADSAFAETFINDYILANEIIERNAADASLKNAAQYGELDGALDALFAQSGAADCARLENIYAKMVEKNKDNLDYLNSTMYLFKGMGCTDSKVFFAAATYAHKIAPSAESANGCAEMCYKNEEYSKAISFYEEAAKLDTNDINKADYFFKIAQIYNSKLNNSMKSREYARLSLEKNPNQGNPYILIGLLYAGSPGIYDDPVLSKTVYWVAVDKFRKAKEVDASPDCMEKAEELIRTYSRYFPSKEDVFMHPDLSSGKQFCVGGWIGECTICR